MGRKLRRTIIGACTISLLVNIMPWLFVPSGMAYSASTWISTKDLSLADLGKIPDGQVPLDSVNGNIDCTQQQLTTRPEITTPSIPHLTLQSEITTEGCVIHTAYGVVDTRSPYLQAFYTNVAGRLTTYNSAGAFLPVPTSLLGIVLTSDGFMRIIPNVISKLKITASPLTQEVNYALSSPPDFTLTDQSGQPLPVSYDSISFSRNGQWMVVNSPGKALLRVNLSSFEILPFGPPFNYSNGYAPNPQTAITNDGRYVAAGSSTFQTLKFYDLASCGTAPSTINSPLNCQSRDLWKEIKTNVEGFSSIGTLRFVDEDILSLYAGSLVSPSTVFNINKYNLSPSGLKYNQLDYLGMGDSFSSGEGAYNYQPGTDDNNNKCHLSVDSYPFLVAGRLNKDSFHSVSCSGATMDDILGSGKDYKGQVKDQIPLFNRDVTAVLQSFNPGYIGQIQFTAHYLPKTITIGISGNDVGFTDIIKECITDILKPTCYNSYEDRFELLQTINAQLLPLTALYSQLKRDSTPDVRIYAVGYPQLVFPGGNCADNVHLDTKELSLMATLVDQLNSMIKSAAISAGVQYADVSQALVGHRLCETVSSNSAVNGLTIGSDIPAFTHGPIGNESYHPNQLGQQLLAKAVLTATNNFNLSMPIKPVASKPQAVAQNKTLGEAVKTGRATKKVIPKQIIPPAVKPAQPYTKKIKGAAIGLAPGRSYTVTVNNQPTATFIAGADADLDITVTLPSNLPTGYHIIDVTGTDLSDQLVDIHQIVYLNSDPAGAQNSTAPSSQQGCLVVSNSGHDVDADGIDDACDGYIGLPSLSISTSPSLIAGTNPTPGPNSSTSTSVLSLQPADNPSTPSYTIIPYVITDSRPSITLSKLNFSREHIVSGPTGQNDRISTHVLGATNSSPVSHNIYTPVRQRNKPYDITKPILALFIVITLVVASTGLTIKQIQHHRSRRSK